MPPLVVETIDGMRASIAARRGLGAVGLVPTMGALHAGHARLVEQARHECPTVVVSIFVNPLQFDRADDLTRYPRPFDADLALCAKLDVDVVFAPTPAVMYPQPPDCTVHAGRTAEHLCGAFRSGHFDGVATVVLKLLNVVQPDVAYFGEKDAQQLAVIRRTVSDLNVPVLITGVPTVREPDGLALSSRNQHLGAAERALAPRLFRALNAVRDAVAAGITDPAAARSRAADIIGTDAPLRLEYLELVDPVTFQPVERVAGPVVAAAALWVGSTRLIDNVLCTPPRFGT
ncbi:MAG TPA: pantoate--beta-alanine ligase [Vicinamibacterales bacterium]|jgi:pantoate--beta-alanine ligase|nr:pantoate--beta-alanine ligase [Vicinamibacterales bacterium]